MAFDIDASCRAVKPAKARRSPFGLKDSLDVNDLRSMVQTRRLTPDATGIAEAAALLRRGGLVAFPTETVYGLGADATNAEAVAGIYAAKERPSFNPLISHLDSFEAARKQGTFDETAERLARAFWPGPLTLVVPAAETCSHTLHTPASSASSRLDSDSSAANRPGE